MRGSSNMSGSFWLHISIFPSATEPEPWSRLLRMAIPGDLKGYEGAAMTEASLPAAVPCQICGTAEAQLPHMNCANIGAGGVRWRRWRSGCLFALRG